MKYKKAFSLIELSIVILIIGIILAAVTQSSRLISKMKLATAKSLTQSSAVASINNLVLWLEPTMDTSFIDAETDDTLEITTWNDINPQTNAKLSAAQSGTSITGITYHANGIAGLPSLKFAGTTDKILLTPLAVSSYASTVFIVYRLSGAKGPSDQYLFSWDSTYIRGATGGTNGSRYIGTSTTWLTPYNDFSMVPEIATITLTGGSTSDTVSLYLNGSKVIDHYVLGGAAISAISSFKIGAGMVSASQSYFNGDIAEIIVFNGVLKISDQKSVEQYLGKKYGIGVS